jgi:hypothetical protein
MTNCTIMQCSNCGKTLKKGEKAYCERTNFAISGTNECAKCRFHVVNGTRTIQEYNKWLRKASKC